jgi:hypothetical protein
MGSRYRTFVPFSDFLSSLLALRKVMCPSCQPTTNPNTMCRLFLICSEPSQCTHYPLFRLQARTWKPAESASEQLLFRSDCGSRGYRMRCNQSAFLLSLVALCDPALGAPNNDLSPKCSQTSTSSKRHCGCARLSTGISIRNLL